MDIRNVFLRVDLKKSMPFTTVPAVICGGRIMLRVCFGASVTDIKYKVPGRIAHFQPYLKLKVTFLRFGVFLTSIRKRGFKQKTKFVAKK